MTDNGNPDVRARVIEQLRASERFILVTHEHPDGDALGSLVAMQGLLTALDKDSVMFMAEDEFPLPHEYRFFEFEGLVSTVPEDLEERAVVFLDCGNIDRNPAHVLRDADVLINIDHHHDNTRFGTLDLVVPEASCTAEIVWELMHSLGVAPSPTIADALYVALVTDTGRFMYETTGPRAHVMAAELIEAGVDVHGIYRRLYEGVPFAKLELLSRALASVKRLDDGRLAVARLTMADYQATEAEESYSEGVIDLLRVVSGTKMAVLIRDMLSEGKLGLKKISLRSTDGTVDVSAIARAQGGGGHRRAAGFSSDLPVDDLLEFLRSELSAQLAPAAF
ncbi:MAG TPA: DHH family phosphoesterase [Solirubrobacteraceae bacterium]|nr:DHH family phosphoesterase [Solirubrobacteraceae bacterium]